MVGLVWSAGFDLNDWWEIANMWKTSGFALISVDRWVGKMEGSETAWCRFEEDATVDVIGILLVNVQEALILQKFWGKPVGNVGMLVYPDLGTSDSSVVPVWTEDCPISSCVGQWTVNLLGSWMHLVAGRLKELRRGLSLKTEWTAEEGQSLPLWKYAPWRRCKGEDRLDLWQGKFR